MESNERRGKKLLLRVSVCVLNSMNPIQSDMGLDDRDREKKEKILHHFFFVFGSFSSYSFQWWHRRRPRWHWLSGISPPFKSCYNIAPTRTRTMCTEMRMQGTHGNIRRTSTLATIDWATCIRFIVYVNVWLTCCVFKRKNTIVCARFLCLFRFNFLDCTRISFIYRVETHSKTNRIDWRHRC